MNKKLLSEHLKSQKTKAAKKATVFVYKGFPIHFLNELNKELPHVSDLHFIKNETISLDAIEKNAKTLFTKLSKTKEKKSFIIYEELLLISAEDRTKLPVEFNIVINNFYEFYPYQADLTFVDIEESVKNIIFITYSVAYFMWRNHFCDNRRVSFTIHSDYCNFYWSIFYSNNYWQ